MFDAVIIGSGPNGLAAGIRLAQEGKSVQIIEGQETLGGGVRTSELILPGHFHDTCSAVHPLAVASPFFRSLPLEKFGLRWVCPPLALAHPLDEGSVACLFPSLEQTASQWGRDGARYAHWIRPWVEEWQVFFRDCLSPLGILPRRPFLMAKAGYWGVRSAQNLVTTLFSNPLPQALYAGLAAHSFLPLTDAPSAAIGIVLGVAAHAVNWPFPEGGAQALSRALASYFEFLGGKIVTGSPVRDLKELPPSKQLFFDLSPASIVHLAGERLPPHYRRQLERFRYGPGVFKMDWILSGPIPWRNPECAQAGIVHLGGSVEEMILSESSPWTEKTADKPFVLLAQPSLFDPTRAPEGRHIVWAYCHVPRNSTFDMSNAIENQIERFAPGFRSRIVAKKISTPYDLEKSNPNYFGGDISGGIANLRQMFFRPALKWNPYSIPVPGWYICSASTPPGAGVHGMCGFHAAESALKSKGTL